MSKGRRQDGTLNIERLSLSRQRYEPIPLHPLARCRQRLVRPTPVEAVVTGGHWSMRREQASLGQIFSAPSAIQEFEHSKGAVSLIQMQALHFHIKVIKQLDTTNAEDVFLTNSHVIVSSIES